MMVASGNTPQGRVYRSKFEMLDGWRGLAAVGVLFSHLAIWGWGTESVMLFFVISGYCIMASAEAGSPGFKPFMKRRLRRIYPPYFFSLLYFIATRILKAGLGGGNELAKWTLVEWLQNLTLTQWVSVLFHPNANITTMPVFVGVYWSLCFEEQFYLWVAVLTMVALRYRRKLSTLVILTLGLSFAWNLHDPILSRGLFLDMWLPFGFGALVYYRLCRFTSFRARRSVEFTLGVAALWGTLSLWHIGSNAGGRFGFTALGLPAIFALLLIALRAVNDAWARTYMGRILMALGKLTYSLYLIQLMSLHFVGTITAKLLPAHSPFVIFKCVEILLHIGIAAIFWYFCERPFLNKKSPAREPAEPFTKDPLSFSSTEPMVLSATVKK